MIQVIAGKKGSGKTKRILDMANLATKDSKHDIVFIDDDNRYMFDLRHEAGGGVSLGVDDGLAAQRTHLGAADIENVAKAGNIGQGHIG